MTSTARACQKDIARAARAAMDAGLQVGEIRVEPNGTIRIIAAGHGPLADSANPWDADLSIQHHKG